MPRLLTRLYLSLVVIAAPLPFGANRDFAGYLLLATTLAVVAMLCLTLAARRELRLPNWHTLIPFAPLLAWVAWIIAQIYVGEHAISAAWQNTDKAVDPLQAILDTPAWLPLSIDPAATWYELKLGILYILLFALTLYAVKTPGHASFLLYAIVSAALLQIGIGYYENLNQVEVLGATDQFNQINGTFINRNHFAGFVACAGAVVLATLIHGLTQYRQYVPGRSRNLLIRWIDALIGPTLPYLLFAVISLTAIASSGSRGATLAFTGSAVVGLLSLALGRPRERRTWGILFTAIAVIALVALYDTLVLSRTVEFLTADGTDGRLIEWRAAWQAIEARPLTGFGLGSFTDAFAIHRDGSLLRLTYDHVHNHFLELTLETGLLGLFLLATFCAYVLKSAARSVRDGSRARSQAAFAALLVMVAAMLHAIVEFNLAIPAITIVFHTGAGIIIALDCRRRNRARS